MRSIAVLVGLGLALTAPTALSGQEAEEDRVRSVIESISEHSQSGELSALDDVYAEGTGVHIIEGAGVNHGWADYRDHHLKPELESFENFTYRYYAVEPVIRGDVAWASFRYDLAVDTERGHTEIEGRGTAVLERLEGQWRVVHLHTSGRPKQGN